MEVGLFFIPEECLLSLPYRLNRAVLLVVVWQDVEVVWRERLGSACLRWVEISA